jgi:hypothetical protein
MAWRPVGKRSFCIVTALLMLFALPTAYAEVTPEQRTELGMLKRELNGVNGMIRRREFDEVEALLDRIEMRVQEISTAAEVEVTDRSMLGLSPLLTRHRNALETARARAEGRPANANMGVSFSGEVAPLIAEKCLGCHGDNNPRANLNLNTFAGWRQGGVTGPLLTPGNANNSLIVARVADQNAQTRMPRGQDPLTQEEIQTLADWINAGANYDGEEETIALADLAATMEEDDPSIVIPEPEGDETVSFTEDIAPFMANLCVGCHSGNNPRGGLSLVSFYDMMKGGDSGRVVLPGNVEGSRLFRLVGGLENPRMPQGQARITRQNYEDLRKWFEEGNTFDGEDPKRPLREYVRTEEDIAAEQFATMTAEQMNEFRLDRSRTQWQRTLPNADQFAYIETADFLIMGDVPQERLREVETWAGEHARNLRQLFDAGDDALWRGRLAVFVFKDRFGYDEFNRMVDRREPLEEMTGHSLVSANYEDAYIALQDVGDTSSESAPSLRINLLEQVTSAFLSRDGSALPTWLRRGLGLVLASRVDRNDAYIRNLPIEAAQIVRAALSPEDIFAEGTFSPASVGPVGYTLVGYIIEQGGEQNFVRLVQQLQGGADMAAAVQAVYQSDLPTLARAYIGSL